MMGAQMQGCKSKTSHSTFSRYKAQQLAQQIALLAQALTRLQGAVAPALQALFC